FTLTYSSKHSYIIYCMCNMDKAVVYSLLLLYFLACSVASIEYPLMTSNIPSLCPDALDINPCRCTTDYDHSLNLECSEVTGGTDLARVFQADFPELNFNRLIIKDNGRVKHLNAGTFGNVTFKEISVKYSGLELVKYHSIQSSFDTLEYLDFSANHLSTFPWGELSNYTSLIELHLASNNITSVPTIYSKSLTNLYLGNNSLSDVPTDVFKHLHHLEFFHLDLAGLTEIAEGTFADMSQLYSIHLFYNDLTRVPEGSFATRSSRLAYIYLSHNKITTVEPGAFPALRLLEVWLRDNQLAEVEEVVWRPLLEAGGRIYVEDNPLLCGCDVAWLVRNQTLMTMVDDAACEDSDITLHSLDPEDYKDC
ncbi:unnamed protein product, partial [Meganyctiphanes norvegica]